MPAGFGRHSIALAESGHTVFAVDIDLGRLAAVRRASPDAVVCVQADGSRPLPFRPGSFDLIVVVHFVADDLPGLLYPLLRTGGHLLFESFGGQGGNWEALPKPGAMRAALEPGFDIRDYRERLVGPTRSKAASVRFLAQAR
jgi:hypothetical protein